MSSKYYSKRCVSTLDDLKDVIATEKLIHKLSPTDNKLTAHSILAGLYARYIVLVNNLNEIFDQIFQPQRRDVIQQLLSASCSRLLELKRELCKTEKSEFAYFDATLIQQHLSPQEVQLLRSFPFKRVENIQSLIDSFRLNCDKSNEINGDNQEAIDNVQVEVEPTSSNRLSENLSVVAFNKHNDRKSVENLEGQQSDSNAYEFQFVEDVEPLYPITKTVLPTNFYVDQVEINFEFYTNPNEKETEEVGTTSQSNLDTELIPDLPPKQCRPPRLFDSIEWLRSQREPKQTESQIMRETLRKELEIKSANCIKRAWRKSRFRRDLRLKWLTKLNLLGIVKDCREHSDLRQKHQDYCENRRGNQLEYAEEYRSTIETLKVKISEEKSAWIEEDIVDFIHNWFRQMYNAAKKFDKFPAADAGGSTLIFTEEVMSPEEFMTYMSKSVKERKAEAKAARKAAKEEKKKLAAEKKEKKRKDKERAKAEFPTWDFSDQDFVTKTFERIEQILKIYESDWRFIAIHDASIHNGRPIIEFIESDIYTQLHATLRETIDVVMREDLERLQKALCADTKKKYKPPKKPKPKKAKSKKKKKKEDPPIDYETTVALFKEVVTAGILMNYPKTNLDDYIADFNYAAYELRNLRDGDPAPGGAEIIQILRTWILGMGLTNAEKPRSICIAGPRGCGKKFLVRALATELNATVLNISPEVVHQFADIMEHFRYLVTQMAKALQPTIIFLDGVHRAYAKKPSEADKDLKPKLIAKFLPKIKAAIKPDDRVMLIGTTDEPWVCKARAMKKVFEKQLLIPSNSYTYAQSVWQMGIEQKLKADPLFAITPLANVTREFTAASILTCIDRVLNEKRVRRIKFIPLQAQEFLGDLLTNSGPNARVPVAQLEKYQKWFQKRNPLERARKKARDKIAAAKEGKNKKK